MRCLACTYEWESKAEKICPRCGFDNNEAHIGSHTQWKQAHKKQALEYRRNFLGRYHLGMTVRYWKDQDGELVQDRAEIVPFAPAFTADMLLDGQARWHSGLFGRVPGEQTQITLAVFRDGKKVRDIPVTLSNPTESELQTPGVRIVDVVGQNDAVSGANSAGDNIPLPTEQDDLRLYIMLRNPSRMTNPAQSEPVDFLSET